MKIFSEDSEKSLTEHAKDNREHLQPENIRRISVAFDVLRTRKLREEHFQSENIEDTLVTLDVLKEERSRE